MHPLLIGFALVAFAANSILCRLALGEGAVDAASFTSIRLTSGAITLFLIITVTKSKGSPVRGGNWGSAAMLSLYAIAFSFAYLSLSAGTGALILFGAVQITMILAALRSGERPHRLEWIGLVIALVGLVYLMSPGLSAPDLFGSFLMALAGSAWGVYSLRGRQTGDPAVTTTGNFIRSVPLVLGPSIITILLSRTHVSTTGVILAVLSGAVASGIGYVMWYAVLKKLTVTRAAMLQLCVPFLAALAGVLFLSEHVSLRLIISGVLILGGVALRPGSARSPVSLRG